MVTSHFSKMMITNYSPLLVYYQDLWLLDFLWTKHRDNENIHIVLEVYVAMCGILNYTRYIVVTLCIVYFSNWMRNLIGHMDFKMLEMKSFMCKLSLGIKGEYLKTNDQRNHFTIWLSHRNSAVVLLRTRHVSSETGNILQSHKAGLVRLAVLLLDPVQSRWKAINYRKECFIHYLFLIDLCFYNQLYI